MNFPQILFKTEMVKANLADLKTQTRRLNGLDEINSNPDLWQFHQFELNRRGRFCALFKNTNQTLYYRLPSPYGEPGDVLWVRETWAKIITPDGKEAFVYKADDDFYKDTIEDWSGWEPSIHMPKAACRLFLQLKSIRVERLQEISGKDAVAEGVLSRLPENGIAQQQFSELWQSINGSGSWNANPWVWVLEYERIEKPQNFL